MGSWMELQRCSMRYTNVVIWIGWLDYISPTHKINTLARRRTEWIYSSGKHMRLFSRHVFLIDDFLDEKLLCITICIHWTSKVTFNYGAWELDAFSAQHYDDKWDFRWICSRLLRFYNLLWTEIFCPLMSKIAFIKK